MPAELRRETEVEANGFSMPNMQMAIRFWWKPRKHTTIVFVCLQVLQNDVSNKVGGRRIGFNQRYESSPVFYSCCDFTDFLGDYGEGQTDCLYYEPNILSGLALFSDQGTREAVCFHWGSDKAP